MAKRIVTKIGNVFCVEIDCRYKCYFQYIANDLSQLNSSVIRVFKTRYPIDAQPKIDDIVQDQVSFYAHTVLRAGIEFGSWYKIGKSLDLGLQELNDVWFGSVQDIVIDTSHGIIIEVDPLSNWYIWHINKPTINIGILPVEYHNNVELGVVIPYIDIVNRIKYGYSKYTSPVFAILKREPWPDVDSYLKVEEEGKTIYYHFKGKNAERELIVTAGGEKIRLTVDHPVVDGYKLRRADFGDTNWQFTNFISDSDFESAWG